MTDLELRSHLLGGYTEEALRAAFDAVADKSNWKLGNTAKVKQEDLALTRYAVSFYTGSNAKILNWEYYENGAGWTATISFAGYYAAVGA